MQNEIFTSVDLPRGGKATIYEGYGKHYFSAMQKAGGDTAMLIKYLIAELVIVNEQKISAEDVDKMHIRDISYLSEVIGTMLSNDFNLQ